MRRPVPERHPSEAKWLRLVIVICPGHQKLEGVLSLRAWLPLLKGFGLVSMLKGWSPAFGNTRL